MDAAEWLEEYELVADEADYSDVQKTKYIQLVLDGTAKSWYKSALKRYEEKLKVEPPLLQLRLLSQPMRESGTF